MTLPRVLEPELMDTFEEALDYNSMDHAEVNRRFVTDLLAAAPELLQPPAEGQVLPARPRTPSPAEMFGLPLDPQPLEVLDLGTGTALIPVELCRRAEYCRVVAADAAQNMLELARYNLEIAGLTERILLALLDAKSLALESDRFPVVMSNSIVHHLPEPAAALAEAVRVTAPGGLLFFRDLLRPDSQAQVTHLVDTYAAGANEHQRTLFSNSLHAAFTLDEVRHLIAALGFSPASVQATSDRHWTWTARVQDDKLTG